MDGSGEIAVEYDRGIHLPDLDLWLDPSGAREWVFVSHAHSDHFGRHDRIICSLPTADVIRERYGFGRSEVQSFEFGKEFALGEGFKATLLPAGHIFGSAQLHVTRETDGATMLYSGDFKVRPGLSSEGIEIRQADTLVMETTFGLPRFVFPPRDDVIRQVSRFCHEAIEVGDVPVLLAYSLGKAQEAHCALGDFGLTPMLHPAVEKMTRVYESYRGKLSHYARWDPNNAVGHVLIVPPASARSPVVREISNRQTAMLSGWGMQNGARYRYQVDEVFPMSDHADYPGLIDYVEAVAPRRILTWHGYASEFARDLSERGYEAWSLLNDNQLHLPLGLQRKARPELATSLGHKRILSPFGDFVDLCDRVKHTTGRLKKIELISRYLQTLSEPNLLKAVRYLSSRVFARSEGRRLDITWPLIRKALLQESGLSEAGFRELAETQNEAGRIAYLSLQGVTNPRATTLRELASFFDALEAARGPHAKTLVLAERLRGLHPAEADILVRILTGDMRVMVKEDLLVESVAHAFRKSLDEVRRVHILSGDLGETAVLAMKNQLGTARLRPFIPIQSMLASPEPDAESVWNRLGHADDPASSEVWVEDKLDGIRAQLHVAEGKAEIYGRDLRALGAEFPEILRCASAGFEGQDVILDGELIAFADGRRLMDVDLHKRLTRKRLQSDLFLGEAIPVRFVAFDVLWHNGNTLLDEPLHLRRRTLGSLGLPAGIERTEVRQVGSVSAVNLQFEAARERGNEGLVVKDPFSTYKPGHRSIRWLKLKKCFETLDVVVVAAERGGRQEGKTLISGYILAVRDEVSNRLVTVGKVSTGLSEEQMEKLSAHFRESTLERRGRKHMVQPNVVLEVAFDSIGPSKRHESGLALRYPRIHAIRGDKSVDDINTVTQVRELRRRHP